MIDATEFEKLKSKLDKVEQRKQRAEGALEQQLKQLKTEFKCNSIEEAQLKLKELKREQKQLETKFETAFKKFSREYKLFLEAVKEND